MGIWISVEVVGDGTLVGVHKRDERECWLLWLITEFWLLGCCFDLVSVFACRFYLRVLIGVVL